MAVRLEIESEANEFARRMMMPKATVLSFFKAKNITSLREIHNAFPRSGFVAQDMQKAITEWVLS